MSEREYGEYEQVNGATLNAANKRIAELEEANRDLSRMLNEELGGVTNMGEPVLPNTTFETREMSHLDKQVERIAELEAKLEAIEKQEPIPSHWNCGCGWHNGLDFSVCSMCGRAPAEGCATYCYKREHVCQATRELSDEEIAGLFEDVVKATPGYTEADGDMPDDVRALVITFTRKILAKARGE